MLDRAHELNRADPSLARFLASARVDIGRHDELRRVLAGSAVRGNAFVEGIVDRAIADREFEPEMRASMLAMLRSILAGLASAVSDDLRAQRLAMDGFVDLLDCRFPAPHSHD
jgi:hypothetical protein